MPHDTEDDLYKLQEFLFSDKNKLDSISVLPLLISPPEFENIAKVAKSEFDLDYKKYNYEVYEQIDPIIKNENQPIPKAYSDTRWINHSTGLTFDRTVDFIVKFRQELGKSNKFKFGEFDYGHLRSLGITEEDLMTLSKNEIQDKYYIRELIEEKRQRYLKQLDSYINK